MKLLENARKGLITSIIGVLLILVGLYMFYFKYTNGIDVNEMYAIGFILFGIGGILSPDTWTEVIALIPKIIKKKFLGEESKKEENGEQSN